MAEPGCAGRCDTAGTRLPSQQLGEGTMSRGRCPHVYITLIYLYINIYIHFSVYANSTLCRLPVARGFEKRKRRTEIGHFQKAANELKCPQLFPLRIPAPFLHTALRTEPHAQPRGSALSGAADPRWRRSGALCPPGPEAAEGRPVTAPRCGIACGHRSAVGSGRSCEGAVRAALRGLREPGSLRGPILPVYRGRAAPACSPSFFGGGGRGRSG